MKEDMAHARHVLLCLLEGPGKKGRLPPPEAGGHTGGGYTALPKLTAGHPPRLLFKRCFTLTISNFPKDCNANFFTFDIFRKSHKAGVEKAVSFRRFGGNTPPVPPA